MHRPSVNDGWEAGVKGGLAVRWQEWELYSAVVYVVLLLNILLVLLEVEKFVI
jgi:hypothetical protein